MTKIYNTAKCEQDTLKASRAFSKWLHSTPHDTPGFNEQYNKLRKAWDDAEKVYSLALAEDYRIQLELEYEMMMKVAKTCMEMGMSEGSILYEAGPFYAYKTNEGIEIRKNNVTHSVLVGIVPSLDRAIRFIQRANLHPNRF